MEEKCNGVKINLFHHLLGRNVRKEFFAKSKEGVFIMGTEIVKDWYERL